ncbi:hypothetical protein D6C76_05036 [Aureobasidium pullulans]|nr:hypothetical protein D6C76_05036 [Aureobasidium pullulans]
MSSTPPLPQDTPEMEAEAETEATLTSNESLQTDMPMTMAASVVLDHLPRDAHDALSKAGMLEQEKTRLPSAAANASKCLHLSISTRW